MRTIEKDGKKFAIKITCEDVHDGPTFFSEDGDFLQVGSWRHEKGKRLKAHNHNIVDRKINRTQEFLFVTKGALKALIYDEDDRPLDELVINEGEGLILFSGGHGYEIMTDDTKVIEVKNGPYVGPELDRRRLEE